MLQHTNLSPSNNSDDDVDDDEQAVYDEEGGSQEWSALQAEDCSGLPSDDLLNHAGALSFFNQLHPLVPQLATCQYVNCPTNLFYFSYY